MKHTRKFYTPPQLGEELGVGESKPRKWIESGELPATNLATSRGGKPRWRISSADVDEFLAARASQPPPPKATKRRKSAVDVIKFF